MVVSRRSPGTLCVSDLVVDHPGMQLVGSGVTYGWHYRVDEDGRWSRVDHADDCPCGDADRHQRHLSALAIIEYWLGETASD